MKRQRGFLGFSVVELVMYGALIVGLLGVAAWGNNLLKHHYVDPAQAKWNAEKASLLATSRSFETDLNTAKAANASLQGQFDTFIATHNAQIEAAADLDKQQRANRAASEKAAAPKMADLAMEKFNLITSLGKPDGGISCDQMDTLLLETAKRRAKFYGEAPPTQPAGGLRLTEPTPTERPKPVNPLRPKP